MSDFGLSKRIEAATESKSKLFGIVPYIDPKSFTSQRNNNSKYFLNEKSDIYSVGVLLWEISSGQPPFYNEGESYDIGLNFEISGGLRETPIPNTPEDYVKLYTGKYYLTSTIYIYDLIKCLLISIRLLE